MDKEIEVDWPDYINMCRSLVFEIKEARLGVTLVTGPPRGGVIPAVIVSHALSLEYIEWDRFNHMVSRLSSTKDVLIVDDIICTGKTLSYFPVHTKAVIYKRVTSTVKPQIFLKEIEDNIWIKFPYEK